MLQLLLQPPHEPLLKLSLFREDGDGDVAGVGKRDWHSACLRVEPPRAPLRRCHRASTGGADVLVRGGAFLPGRARGPRGQACWQGHCVAPLPGGPARCSCGVATVV